MEPAARRRHWRNIVDHAQFHAVLEQGREARTNDDLGVQLMEALIAVMPGPLSPCVPGVTATIGIPGTIYRETRPEERIGRRCHDDVHTSKLQQIVCKSRFCSEDVIEVVFKNKEEAPWCEASMKRNSRQRGKNRNSIIKYDIGRKKCDNPLTSTIPVGTPHHPF